MRTMKLLFAFLMMLIFITQCSKNNPMATEQESDPTLEIMGIANEINTMDDMVFADSTDVRRPPLLRRALFRLDELLDRVHFFIVGRNNAEADSLYRDAREAQRNAVEAAKIDSFRVAFDYIQQSRHLALEAVRLVREDIQEDVETVLARLREQIAEVKAMFDEIEDLLAGQSNEEAEMVFRRAKHHLRMAHEAIQNRKLRDAGFHVVRSKKYAQLALRILNDSG